MIMAKNEKDIARNNRIIEIFQDKKNLKFGHEKSQYMTKDGKSIQGIIFNSKEMIATNKYKYLGDILTHKNDYNKMVEERKNTGIAAVNTIISICTNNKNTQNNIKSALGRDKIKNALFIYKGTVLPGLLFNSSTWVGIIDKNIKTLEEVQKYFT